MVIDGPSPWGNYTHAKIRRLAKTAAITERISQEFRVEYS